MKALVYHNSLRKVWEEKKIPTIMESSDAIVKILQTTKFIAGFQVVKDMNTNYNATGRIIGHEGVGIIEEVGNTVSMFKRGDHVIISNITSCGKCINCMKDNFSLCEFGGELLGNTIDGTNAEYVRIPCADYSLYPVTNDLKNEKLVTLVDVMPWAFKTNLKLW